MRRLKLLGVGLVALTVFAFGVSASPRWGALSEALAANPTDPAIPELDHFRCYRISKSHGTAVDKEVRLTDQFGTGMAKVMKPVRFCNPTIKVHSGQVTEISNPDAHLKLYKIETPQGSFPKTVIVKNQFGEKRLKVLRPEVLGVPV